MWDLSPRSADRPAGSRRAPARRILTAGLGLGAVVATAAVAHASSDGDGFFNSQPNHHAEMRHVAPAVAGQAAAQSAWMWADGTPVTGNTQLPSFCLRATPAQNTQTQNGHWQDGRWVQNTQTQNTQPQNGHWQDGHWVQNTQTQNTQPQNGHWQDGHWVQNASTSSDSADSGDSEDMDHWMSDNHGDDDDMPARAVFGRRWWGQPKVAVKVFVDRRDPTFNQLLGINDNGAAVGYTGSGADAAHPNKGILVRPPYRQWNIVDRNVPGAVQTQEIGINAVGTQVGFSIGKDGATSGFVRSGNMIRLVHNPKGTAHPAVDQLLGINDFGIAAGFYNDAQGHSHGYLVNVCTGAFLGVRIPAAFDSLQATGVNDRGVVTGFYSLGKVTHGFVLDHGRFSTLDLGNKMMTQAFGLDNAGDIVGSFVDRHGATHGFVWTRGHLRVIDVPHASGGTVVNGLNNRGLLVGFFTTADKRTLGFVAS